MNEKDRVCASDENVSSTHYTSQLDKPPSQKTGREKLIHWLNGSLKIKMTDGRVLVGNFFCTDRDSNVILGSSGEYLCEEDVGKEEPRILGLVMVPGRHIVSIHYLM